MPRERPAPPPATAPTEVRRLTLGVPFQALLDCSSDDCNHWYRIDVPESGRLEVVLERGEHTARSPTLRMLIRRPTRPVLQRSVAAPDEPLALVLDAEATVYALLVQTGHGRQAYTLTATLVSEAEGGAEPE